MSFPLGVLCLFLGGVFVWVASHGTSATSPWTLFQQVLAGFSGTAATATRPADPWDAVGGAGAVGASAGLAAQIASSGGNAAGGGSVHTGSGTSHRGTKSSLNLPGADSHAADAAAINRILNTPDTTAADQALIADTQRKIDAIQKQFDALGH